MPQGLFYTWIWATVPVSARVHTWWCPTLCFPTVIINSAELSLTNHVHTSYSTHYIWHVLLYSDHWLFVLFHVIIKYLFIMNLSSSVCFLVTGLVDFPHRGQVIYIDDLFKLILLHKSCHAMIQISLIFASKGATENYLCQSDCCPPQIQHHTICFVTETLFPCVFSLRWHALSLFYEVIWQLWWVI